MNLTVWIIIFIPLCVFAYYVWRMRRDADSDNRHDTGQAIIDFARAFPNEAIRSLHMTADGNTVFVRLHDNKAGFMRNMGAHYSCMLLDPERIHIEHLETGDGFVVTFADAPKHTGAYRFKTVGEAAEVSLWLLGSLLEAAEPVALLETEAADTRTEGDGAKPAAQGAEPASGSSVSPAS